MKIIIVEDDQKLRVELVRLLESNGYETEVVTHFTDQIIEDIKDKHGDLLLLDINLPKSDGFAICRTLKQQSPIPIIFVTSRNTIEDEVKSIRVGGNDFITKPYNTTLLLEKIKRSLNHQAHNHKELTVHGVTLDLPLSLIKNGSKEVELTRNEFRILYYFFLHPDRVITKEELLDDLWNDKFYLDENILTVNINRLRKKLEEIDIYDFIQTVRGKGYRI